MSLETFASGSHFSETTYTIETNDENLPHVLQVQGVRITPGHIHFINAFEGKRFEHKMVIQNCGDHLAFIRMTQPSSKCFKIKAFPDGIYLSPGMKVIRTVKYVYRVSLGILKGFVTLWINKQEVTYHFLATLTQSVVSVDPQLLDFGRIDAVNRASTKLFYMKNGGHKNCMFSIDLGRNPLDLVVRPTRGVVPAMGSIQISVEIIGSKPGEFIEEFWIKIDPPLRVVVMGTFIEPKILVRRLISSLDFTLIDFPKTYYGSHSTKPLFIRNFSSCNSMFCVMADIKGTTMTLKEARKIDDHYNNFTVTPIDGRLAALKGAIIQMTFHPVRNPIKEKNYSACFLKVIRMDCRDVDINDSEETVERKSLERLSFGSPSTEQLEFGEKSAVSIISGLDRDEILEDLSELSFEHSIGVCLHGEKETPGISLRPTVICLTDLVLEQEYRRELLVTNKSQFLPIKVKYQKTASVNVYPEEFELIPEGKLEIMLTIKAAGLGANVRKVIFNLFSRDNPEDKIIVRKVGTTHLKIHMDTTKVTKKVRLEQCVLCKEEIQKLEQEKPYRCTRSEIIKKKENDNYYHMYLLSLQKKPSPPYEIEGPIFNCKKLTPEKSVKKSVHPLIPLTPSLLYNVKITPKSITLKKVAAFTTIFEFFEIENLNTFPIRVLTRPSKPCIAFENDSRYLIGSQEKRKIYFSFSTTTIGKYHINIDIIINDSTLFEITAVAQVVSKTLKVESEEVIFRENDGEYKFFRLFNSLNTYTTFHWEVPEGCYTIRPLNGGIQAERSMLCVIHYNPDVALAPMVECVLTSESGQQKTITISRIKRQHLVVFDNYEIDCGAIPLNIPVKEKFVLKNLKNFQVMYRLDNSVPIPGVVVKPTQGMLDPLDSQVFSVNIKLNVLMDFSTTLHFYINEKEVIDVCVKGTVEYPAFNLKPNLLNFRRISPYSFDTLAFRVKNLSKCEFRISFPFEEYPEFNISETEEDWEHKRDLVLRPEESKILFLHFHPQYISTFTLYLPYIVNGILGPVYINSSPTISPKYFLRELSEQYENCKDVSFRIIPRTLPTIRINSSATNLSIRLSDNQINFIYFGKNHYNNFTSKDFEITNGSKETVEICIRIDDLIPPFMLTPKDDSKIEFYALAHKITLEPKETITYEATFTPENYGKYEIQLPIFLRGYYDNKIFNFLKMAGTYDLPTITPSISTCYFESVPIGVGHSVPSSLHLQNHFEDCRLKFISDLNCLHVRFDKKNIKRTKNESWVPIRINYSSIRSRSFATTLKFKCTCNAESSILVTGVMENCVLSTHAFSNFLEPERESCEDRPWYTMRRSKRFHVTVHKNFTCFPLFPDDNDDSEYGKYMRRVQKTLENWTFSQGFYMTSYYRIPDGFNDYCKVTTARRKLRFGGFAKGSIIESPFLQFVGNFVGTESKQYLAENIPESKDEVEWLTYMSKTNCNILTYLRNNSVNIPHVKTKYLLNYDQYVLYEKIKHPQNTPMEEVTFNRLSKQCWVDVILQFIKIFFYNRVVDGPDDEYVDVPADYECKRQISVVSTDMGEDLLSSGIYGNREKTLMDWLQNCYNKEKDTLWSSPPRDIELTFLDEDLRDGLILGAVTAHYCPYVESEIQDMYTKPQNSEELYHNACTLVKTWKILKLSYIITPESIENNHMVEMLLLVSYLYSVLPNYKPKDKITIETPLTETQATHIQIENLGDDPIYYQLVFFGNENNYFTTPESLVVIQPNSAKAVKVQYHAKTVNPTTTTLLFSGETPGHKCGKSVAIKLMGVADVSHACMEIPLNVEMYKPCRITLQTQSPFKVAAEYTLLFGYQPYGEKNVLYPWNEIKNLKIAKEFILQDDICQFDDDGKCTTLQTLCCQQLGPRDMWFYFTNPEVGDWGIKLTVTGKVTEDCYEKIEVVIPNNYEALKCRCKGKKKFLTRGCPKLINVRLPMKNNPLWNARKLMLLYNVEGAELQFWSNIIFSPTGTRILKLILNSETHPMNQMIEETVKYKVEQDQKNHFVTFNKVTFDDVTSEDYYSLLIHPLRNLLNVKYSTLRLVSDDEVEKRFYKLYYRSNTEMKETTTNVG